MGSFILLTLFLFFAVTFALLFVFSVALPFAVHRVLRDIASRTQWRL